MFVKESLKLGEKVDQGAHIKVDNRLVARLFELESNFWEYSPTQKIPILYFLLAVVAARNIVRRYSIRTTILEQANKMMRLKAFKNNTGGGGYKGTQNFAVFPYRAPKIRKKSCIPL